MSFGPQSLARRAGAALGGRVDYRLVRSRVVDQYERGRLSRLDVCDAQSELLRAARNCGRALAQPCPICTESTLVLVSYVFGARLPAHGRCVTTAREMDRLSRRSDTLAGYLVEVCTQCRWNHLLQSFPVGGNARARAR